MRAFLAYFAMVSGGLGVIYLLAYSSISERVTHYKFDGFGLEAHARMAIARTDPSLVGVALSTASIGIGIGLLRRRNWAREWWLALCILWFALSIFCLSYSKAVWEALVPIGFRLLILIVSFKVLCRDDIRREFLTPQILDGPVNAEAKT